MASRPASPGGHDADTRKRKFSHTTAAQRECLLRWLELPGNFALLTTPARPGDRLKGVKKTDGYRSLASYMNVVAQTDWSEKTARSRFESFMAAFRKAKRQPQLELPPIYRRLDALFGPDGYPESRLRSESLGQRSDSDLAPATGDEHAKSPPRRRPRTDTESTPTRTGPAESVGTVKAAAATAVAMIDAANAAAVKGEAANVAAVKGEAGNVVPNPTVKSEAADAAAVALESQRLAVRQQELELRQSELRARQEENRQKLRAEVLTRLVEAGKSPAEVREYLAIMDPVETPPPSRR